MKIGSFEFNLRETAGSLGDFGTLLPLAIGYITVCGLNPAGLLFLHADTILPDGWQDDVFEALLDASAVGGGFGWKTDLDNPLMRIARFFVQLRTIYGQQPWGDQAIFARRRDFEAIGGFPDVPIAEDWDFVRALRRRGRIVAIPKDVLTSSRRWRKVGTARGFLINRLIILGCRLGLDRSWLRRLY